MTSGERRVLVCEIWEGLPRRCVRRCRTPWGACECAFAPAPALYVTPRKAQVTPIKPSLRLMTKSDDELFTLEDVLTDFIEVRAAAGGVITRDMLAVQTHAAKIHKMISVSAGVAGDVMFARQLRRKFC